MLYNSSIKSTVGNIIIQTSSLYTVGYGAHLPENKKTKVITRYLATVHWKIVHYMDI